jgi:hypothetical protein
MDMYYQIIRKEDVVVKDWNYINIMYVIGGFAAFDQEDSFKPPRTSAQGSDPGSGSPRGSH